MAKPIPLDRLPVWDNHTTEPPEIDTFAAGGVIPVDKPSGWTSFDIVKFVRSRIGVRKVGHAGTLDPMATGLLLLGCGKATKTLSRIQDLEKVYRAEVTLGGRTPSFDAETEVVETAPYGHVTETRLRERLDNRFTGRFEQVPPIYSAIRKKGKRLYELARKGESVTPDPRQVEVHHIQLLSFSPPTVRIEITCAKGFYVRSLAHDLGRELGTFGYLTSLRRVATGPFHVDRAWDTEQFNNWISHGRNGTTR